MDSTVDEQNAIDVYHQLSQLWEKAGMHARKWLSNSTQVLKEVRQDRLTNCSIYRIPLQITGYHPYHI